MTKKMKKLTLQLLMVLAGAMLLAGCGGGGGGAISGGSTSVSHRSPLRLNVSLPREAFTTGESYYAVIEVLEMDETGAINSVATSTTGLTLTEVATDTYNLSGYFVIDNVPAGDNYVTQVAVYVSYDSTSQPRLAQTTVTQPVAYVGGLADIYEGVWNYVDITPRSSIAAVAAMKYCLDASTPIPLSELPQNVEDAINTVVSGYADTDITGAYMQWLANYQYIAMYSPFDPADWQYFGTFEDELALILEEAQLIAGADPTVIGFVPADGATGVLADGQAFRVQFSKTMDATVDLNTQTTLAASGFSVTIQRADTGTSLTINSSNALNFGTFSWDTTTNTNDTLVFTLLPNATLEANNLYFLRPSKTYNITAFTVPTNLVDLSGNPVDPTGLPATGSFTVSADATPPQVSSFSPATGATGVQSDGTVFKVIFDETMNSSVNLNLPSVLQASGFSITLQRVSTGLSLTLDATNALSYGTFSWATTTEPDDTLQFTLFSTSQLQANSLTYLKPGEQYNITARTVPTNLTDLAGNAVSSTGIATTGSFTTTGGI